MMLNDYLIRWPAHWSKADLKACKWRKEEQKVGVEIGRFSIECVRFWARFIGAQSEHIEPNERHTVSNAYLCARDCLWLVATCALPFSIEFTALFSAGQQMGCPNGNSYFDANFLPTSILSSTLISSQTKSKLRATKSHSSTQLNSIRFTLLAQFDHLRQNGRNDLSDQNNRNTGNRTKLSLNLTLLKV